MLDSDEPALYRISAAFSLALLGCGDGESSVDYFRTVVEVAGEADPADASRRLIVPASDAEMNTTAGKELERLVSLARTNISVRMDPVATVRTREYREGLATHNIRAWGGPKEEHMFTFQNPELFAPELRRRLEIGGNACDCCGKTLQELGVPRLNCCSRCKVAYYCSVDCQTKKMESWAQGSVSEAWRCSVRRHHAHRGSENPARIE